MANDKKPSKILKHLGKILRVEDDKELTLDEFEQKWVEDPFYLQTIQQEVLLQTWVEIYHNRKLSMEAHEDTVEIIDTTKEDWYKDYVTNPSDYEQGEPLDVAFEELEEKTESKTFDWLLFFAAFTCPADQRDEILGYLTERYNKDREHFGERKAQMLLARDIGCSLYPVIKDFLRSKTVSVLKSGGLEVVVKYFLG